MPIPFPFNARQIQAELSANDGHNWRQSRDTAVINAATSLIKTLLEATLAYQTACCEANAAYLTTLDGFDAIGGDELACLDFVATAKAQLQAALNTIAGTRAETSAAAHVMFSWQLDCACETRSAAEPCN